MKRVVPAFFLAACLAAFSSDAMAEDVGSPPSPPLAAVPVQKAGTFLPKNTPVYLRLNETLNTKSKKTKKGNTFALSVARNVILDKYIVIPRGSRAIGTVAMRTRKGAFGKSGKMEISLDYIEVGDHRIDIQGQHREEGEGNSTATVATFVFLSMLGSGLITGHSAEIMAGTEFTAWTKEDEPVQLPAGAESPTGSISPQPVMADALMARPLAKPPVPIAPARSSFGNSRVSCSTCR